MKTLILASIILLSSFAFGQKLFVKNADLVLEAKTQTEHASVVVTSKQLNINYTNKRPEILSKGSLQIGSLKTEHIHLQDLINKYSSEDIEFDLTFFTEQFQDHSNLEFSFNSVINISINNITKEIPVTIIISNSKTTQTNFYLISVRGTISLEDFDIEISFLENDVNFSYRQNVQVKN